MVLVQLGFGSLLLATIVGALIPPVECRDRTIGCAVLFAYLNPKGYPQQAQPGAQHLSPAYRSNDSGSRRILRPGDLGWLNSRFYNSRLKQLLRRINAYLIQWTTLKHKRLKGDRVLETISFKSPKVTPNCRLTGSLG